ncbi:MAG: hypothetical protein HN353_11820 [Bdellovibrionales bacterium]|jgi:hypothetical protein|nr:hypothetical protein [Bdellovibrionales bacterium]MBT3526837.1 hypothetical protein [Bdellovibrionales bacterium]MBT7668293.1 hypothetical protein [Bdellovibrionales bacterium]
MVSRILTIALSIIIFLLFLGCGEKFTSTTPWDDLSLRDHISQDQVIAELERLEGLTNHYPRGEALKNYIYEENVLKSEDDSFSISLYLAAGVQYFTLKDQSGATEVAPSKEELYSGHWVVRQDSRKTPFILLEFFNGEEGRLTTLDQNMEHFNYNDHLVKIVKVEAPELLEIKVRQCRMIVKNAGKKLNELMQMTIEDTIEQGIDLEACTSLCKEIIDQASSADIVSSSQCRPISKAYRKKIKACKTN